MEREEFQFSNTLAHLFDGNLGFFFKWIEPEKNTHKFIEFLKLNSNLNPKFRGNYYVDSFLRIFFETEKFQRENDLKKFPIDYFKTRLKAFMPYIGKNYLKHFAFFPRVEDFLRTFSFENLSDETNFKFGEPQLLFFPFSNPCKSSCLIDAHPALEELFRNFNKLPGILSWHDGDSTFFPVREKEDLKEWLNLSFQGWLPFKQLKKLKAESKENSNYLYLLHLSDLHFGKTSYWRKKELLRLLKNHPFWKEDIPLIILITGDLMDSPSQENFVKVQSFLDELSQMTNFKTLFVPGNHDVDKKGIFSIFRKNRSASISLFSTNEITVLEDFNLILIPICSNQGGHFACGEIGENQLIDIAYKLDQIKDLDKYTLIALLHHHPIEVQIPNWYQKNWYEKILGKFHEDLMKLNDSERFLEWAKERNIRVILHGHKHIPHITSKDDFTFIGAGSSLGDVEHIDKSKTFLSYNLIKYDLCLKKPIQATIYYEDVIGANIKHLRTVSF